MQHYKELFDFAIRIEENGMNFYQQAMKNTENGQLKLLFQYLADEEFGHQYKFSQMRDQTDAWEETTMDAKDNFRFLNAFIKNVVFSSDMTAQRDALANEHDILRFALQRESESILYYEEIKRLFSKNAEPMLNQIIEEEIQHYLKLSELIEKF